MSKFFGRVSLVFPYRFKKLVYNLSNYLFFSYKLHLRFKFWRCLFAGRLACVFAHVIWFSKFHFDFCTNNKMFIPNQLKPIIYSTLRQKSKKKARGIVYGVYNKINRFLFYKSRKKFKKFKAFTRFKRGNVRIRGRRMPYDQFFKHFAIRLILRVRFKLNYYIMNNESEISNLKTNVLPGTVSTELLMVGRNEVISLSYANYISKRHPRYFKKRQRLPIPNYKFRNSLLGLKVEFAGRFSRAQRKYFSYHQKGRVPFNSFIIPIRTFCLPVILKYGVSTVKIWVAYPLALKLINYAFLHLQFNYVQYSNKIFYFANQTWFTKPSISQYLKNKRFKVSTKEFGKKKN